MAGNGDPATALAVPLPVLVLSDAVVLLIEAIYPNYFLCKGGRCQTRAWLTLMGLIMVRSMDGNHT